jgi:hypothetical protein
VTHSPIKCITLVIVYAARLGVRQCERRIPLMPFNTLILFMRSQPERRLVSFLALL